MLRSVLASIHGSEEGHIAPAVGTLAGGAGAIVLAIGAANDNGLVAIIGGIALAVGIFGVGAGHHRTIDTDLYKHIDKLEGK